MINFSDPEFRGFYFDAFVSRKYSGSPTVHILDVIRKLIDMPNGKYNERQNANADEVETS